MTDADKARAIDIVNDIVKLAQELNLTNDNQDAIKDAIFDVIEAKCDLLRSVIDPSIN